MRHPSMGGDPPDDDDSEEYFDDFEEYDDDDDFEWLDGVVPKPEELLSLDSVTEELFGTLRGWFDVPSVVTLDLNAVDLGRGKRVLVPGGKLHAKYQITLPADLDEQLG